jgi:tetratricopeptide (TPR) repeat protein
MAELAAKCYEKAGAFEQAAIAYAAAYDNQRNVRYVELTAKCYEKAGAFEQAAVYWTELSKGHSMTAKQAVHSAAQCYQKAGMADERCSITK